MDLQDLGLRPRLTELGLHFYTTFRGSVWALKSEKPDLHHSSPLLLLPSLTTLAWSLHVCSHLPLLMLEILCPPPPFCLPISLGNLLRQSNPIASNTRFPDPQSSQAEQTTLLGAPP